MNSDLIMKSNLLDIIFENRNKSYGAYILRKFYHIRLIKSLVIVITTVMVFSALTLLPSSTARTDVFIVKDPEFGKIIPPPKIPVVKAKTTKPTIKKPASTLKWTNSISFVNNKDSADVLRDLNNLSISSNTNTLINNPGTQQIIPSTAGGNEVSESIQITETEKDITKPIENPEVMPVYPGGIEALRKFLVINLSNPREMEEGELISVKVKFVVGYDGKLQRFEMVQDGGIEFNNEVIRVLKKMPAWIPGKSNGQNVSVYFSIPVKFIGED